MARSDLIIRNITGKEFERAVLKVVRQEWDKFGESWADGVQTSIKESILSGKEPYQNRSNKSAWALTPSSKKEKASQGYGSQPNLVRSGKLVNNIRAKWDKKEKSVNIKNVGMTRPWYASKSSRDVGGEDGYSNLLHEGRGQKKARPHLFVPKTYEPDGTKYSKVRDKQLGVNFSKIVEKMYRELGA